jgi:hypothetical protein
MPVCLYEQRVSKQQINQNFMLQNFLKAKNSPKTIFSLITIKRILYEKYLPIQPVYCIVFCRWFEEKQKTIKIHFYDFTQL